MLQQGTYIAKRNLFSLKAESKEDMSIFNNIFHYYRGQAKKGSTDTKQLQIENNTTKAFLNVLQHSSPLLTENFIAWLGFPEQEGHGTFDYMYQVPNKLHQQTPQAVIIGIAETEVVKNTTEIKNDSIPDGAIISHSISLLIETKIGSNSFLQKTQLEDHQDKFADQQHLEDTIIVTWAKLREFFLAQQALFSADPLTSFLLQQFEAFCIINCIGSQKTDEYFLLHFENTKAQELARNVHRYIWHEADYKNIENANTKDGIGYRKMGKAKFATLTTKRQRCLILHLGKKEKRLGLRIQQEIDKTLGRPFDRKNYEVEKYPNEAYIRLEWVEDFEQIQRFVDLAYQVR